MNWPDFRNRLKARHHRDDLQRHARVEVACRLVEEGLGQLAALGHLFHLAPGPAPPLPAFPRLVFHVDGRTAEVHHPSDLLDLGPGWFDSIEVARQEAGLTTQFAGRGGVARQGALVPVGPSPSTRPHI